MKLFRTVFFALVVFNLAAAPCWALRDPGMGTFLTPDPSMMKIIVGQNYWVVNGEKVPDGSQGGEEQNEQAKMVMEDKKDASYGAVPVSSAQDVLAFQAQQLNKIADDDGPLYPSRIHYLKEGNPNFYAYANNNPWSAIDPDGLDVVMLNESDGGQGKGHEAILVGDDKHGWIYYSKDGGNQNTRVKFATLKAFEKSEYAKYYRRQYHIKTTVAQDEKMKAFADKTYNGPFAICKVTDPTTGLTTAQNCGDFVASVLNAGGVATQTPTEHIWGFGTFTVPNYEFGTFIKDHPGGMHHFPLTLDPSSPPPDDGGGSSGSGGSSRSGSGSSGGVSRSSY